MEPCDNNPFVIKASRPLSLIHQIVNVAISDTWQVTIQIFVIFIEKLENCYFL